MTEGLESCLSNLTKLQVNCRRKAREAVSEGADYFSTVLSSNTPKLSGFLQEDVKVSGFKGGTQGAIEKDIGYGSTGWRAKYPDDGTINQNAQHFIEQSKNQARPKMQQIYAEKVREGLNL